MTKLVSENENKGQPNAFQMRFSLPSERLLVCLEAVK